MVRICLRLWLVLVGTWLSYNLYLHRDIVNTFRYRGWARALEFGLNSLACDLKVAAYCRDLQVPFFQRSNVVETWGLIVIYVGWPLAALLACLILAWILHMPAIRPGRAH